MNRLKTPAALCLALSLAFCGPGPDLVKSDGITSPLHRAHLGEVVFTAEPVPLQDLRESDFLTTFDLIENRGLDLRAFMADSLTNDLHRLAPAMSAEDLGAKGNFQFSFYVDGTLVYRENLTPGAGSLEAKNSRTTFRVPLISTAGEDSWGRFLWMRFMARGGDEALSEGKHALKIEIRPYLEGPEPRTGAIIAAGGIALNVIKPAVDEAAIAPQAVRPSSGWPLSSDGYDIARIRELNRKIAQKDFKDITSIVVIKDGKLLVEEYFNGADRATLHDTRSVGKTFTSALIGAAIRDGFIKSLDQTLGEFYDLKAFANFSPKKSAVTLRDLLTMSSAFLGSDGDAASPGNEENMYPTANWVKFVLDLPMDGAKENGKQWDYFTAGVVLLGDILDRSVPGGLERYADRVLFKPLGITRYEWQHTPQKVVNTAGGLQMSALDYARFGQLYKNGGRWNGAPVLPEEWVARSFRKYLPVPNSVDVYYGLLFWNMTYHVGGRARETFFCTGNGGSKIFVFTDQPLVVVITATAYGKPYMHSQVDKMMERYILPAVDK